MKRVQMFLAGAFIAVGSLYAQSSDAEWQAGVAKLKETIQTNPAQAAEEAEHLIKGKNKKNVELLVAIGDAYLNADKIPEAQEYSEDIRDYIERNLPDLVGIYGENDDLMPDSRYLVANQVSN